MSFIKNTEISANKYSVQCFTGTPDCAAFYAWVLDKLMNGLSKWQPVAGPLTTGQVGNLGEYISYMVARQSGLSGGGYTAALAGALTPLQIGTTPGLDITILHLDPGGDTSKDALYIQEVKTTGQNHLGYANALVADYKKLLDLTQPSTSLGSRMSWLKFKLDLEHNFPRELLDRADDLYRPDAKDCTRIKLLPTLVHDLNTPDPVIALDKVMAQIVAMGWSANTVEPWSIALKRLNDGLAHLAKQSAFVP
jgi:hypothetical protein